MGFETPLLLLALAAAGLPVLAHLLRRRDLPVRWLPTVALLRRAEASSRRRMRLVDLLLLIARVLLVAALALAVAGPFLRVTLAYGDGTAASVAIVLDDSMSMTGRGDPTPYEEARQRAITIVESLPAGSEVAIVLAGAPARVALARTDDLDAARAALSELHGDPARGTDVLAGIERARHELAGARHVERRVVVLTDLARHARVSEVPVAAGLHIEFEVVGEDAPTANAAIVSARATPDPTTPDMVSIAVEIRASGGLEAETAELVLERGGTAIANATVELNEQGGRATLHAAIDPTDPGATLSLDLDDAIDVDDRRGVLIRPPAGARVLIVDGDPHPVRGDDEARFLARALDLAPEHEGALQRRIVDPDTFAAMDLADAEVVVLANVPTPSRASVDRLREHVRGGGGLLIAPGDHFDARAMIAALGNLWPTRPLDAISADVEGPFGAGDDLVPAGASGLDRARTHRRITFEDLPVGAGAPLRFGDGSPAMVVAPYGDGRVAVFATTLDDDWTDLPYQPGFLPLVVRSMRMLSPSTSTSDAPLHSSEVVRMRAPAGARQVRLATPAGEAHVYDDVEDEIAFEDTATPGVYRAEISTRDRPLQVEPRLAFVVAPPADESDLTPGEPPTAERAPESPEGGAVVERSLAPWLFALAGLLAIGEAALRLRVPRAA
ncbi:MAG: VWA domain-containing protein [Sandaracinaceae bacterium]|nr:VWA domain-containing protein [Sandaracinaceae bacterium]